MPKLYNQKTGDLIGEISDGQLQFLVDQLEEEDTTDKDYYINADTLALFREKDGDAALIKMIEDAMEDGEIDIEWR